MLRAVDVSRVIAELGDTVDSLASEGWVPVVGDDGRTPAVFVAQDGDAAIRMHTGSGADVIEGRWKAVAVSSWVGWQETRRVTAEDRERGREELV